MRNRVDLNNDEGIDLKYLNPTEKILLSVKYRYESLFNRSRDDRLGVRRLSAG